MTDAQYRLASLQEYELLRGVHGIQHLVNWLTELHAQSHPVTVELIIDRLRQSQFLADQGYVPSCHTPSALSAGDARSIPGERHPLGVAHCLKFR